jgi:hypothetical protein
MSSAPPRRAGLVTRVVLSPRGDRAAPLVYKQGAHAPYAIRWYGATSLFGHFRNFIATAIASESVDSRDWMRPLAPEELLDNAVRTLSLDEGVASGVLARSGSTSSQTRGTTGTSARPWLAWCSRSSR